MVVVPLTKNRNALVSKESFKLVSKYTWHFEGRYAATTIFVSGKKKKLYMHRLLLPNEKLIDHKNQNKLDNRLENLRPSSKSKNALNTSGAKGTYFVKSGNKQKRWLAQIQINGKRKSLGFFLTEKEARSAYLKELVQLNG